MKRGFIGVGIGFSDADQSSTAGINAARSASVRLGNQEVDFAIVFIAGAAYDLQQVMSAVKSILPCEVVAVKNSHIISYDAVYNFGVSVVTIKSQDIKFHALLRDITCEGTERKQGALVAAELIDGNIGKAFSTAVVKVGNRFVQISPYTLFLINNTLCCDNAELLRGVLDVCGGVFQIVGAVSSGVTEKRTPFLAHNESFSEFGAMMLLLSSKVPTGRGVATAWKPVGGAHIITQSQKNVVYEIDNLRASKIYENYLSKTESFLQEQDFNRLGLLYPLGVVLSFGEVLIRNPYSINNDGSLTFNGTIREGCAVRFMTCQRSDILDAVTNATEQAMSSLGKAKPALVFAFISIVDEMQLLGDINMEVRAIKEIVGEDVPVVGFYSYGEYSRERIHSHKLYSNSASIFIIGH